MAIIKQSSQSADLIIVLGLQLNDSWQLKPDLIHRLDLVVEYFQNHPKVKIIVSGRSALNFDKANIKPLALECELMKKYLVEKDLPKNSIIMESKSKDTIGNAYYSKLYAKKYPKLKNLLIVCSTQHKRRSEMLFNKFFGSEYTINFLTAKAIEHNTTPSIEIQEISKEKILLKDVRDGHDEDFKYQLYTNNFYSIN